MRAKKIDSNQPRIVEQLRDKINDNLTPSWVAKKEVYGR